MSMLIRNQLALIKDELLCHCHWYRMIYTDFPALASSVQLPVGKLFAFIMTHYDAKGMCASELDILLT